MERHPRPIRLLPNVLIKSRFEFFTPGSLHSERDSLTFLRLWHVLSTLTNSLLLAHFRKPPVRLSTRLSQSPTTDGLVHCRIRNSSKRWLGTMFSSSPLSPKGSGWC